MRFTIRKEVRKGGWCPIQTTNCTNRVHNYHNRGTFMATRGVTQSRDHQTERPYGSTPIYSGWSCKNRLFVGSSNGSRKKLLQEMHASTYGGHSVIQDTYMRLKAFCFWPHNKQKVTELVMNCDVCAKNKPGLAPYPGLLQPLPIPDQPCTHISSLMKYKPPTVEQPAPSETNCLINKNIFSCDYVM